MRRLVVFAGLALAACAGDVSSSLDGGGGAGRDSGSPPLDSAPRDSEPADSAAADSASPAVDSGSPRFDCSTAVFCEDFEAVEDFVLEGDSRSSARSAPAGSGWTDVNVGAHGEAMHRAQLRRETARAHRGAASLRAALEWRGDLTAWSQMRHHVERRPELFIRFFVYLPAASASVGADVAIAWLGEDTGAYYGTVGLALEAGTAMRVYGYGGTFEDAPDVTGALATDRWVCLELRVTHGASPSFTAWRDDEEIVSAMPLTLGDRTLSQAMFGQYGGWNTGDVELFYDDIVIATERIGCER